MEEIEAAITKLEELVLEENRIVTFKSLSQYCGINILKAKGIMKDFHQKNKDNLSACYIIWGYKCIDDEAEKATMFALSRGNELEKTKATFSKILDCDIYSISRSMPKEIGDIYSNEVALRQISTNTVPPRIRDSRLKVREPTKSIKSETVVNENTNAAFPKSFEQSNSTKSTHSNPLAVAFAKTIDTKSDTIQKKPEQTNTNTKKSQTKNVTSKGGGAMMAFVKKGVTPNTVKETPKNMAESKPDVKALEKEMWSDSCDEENEEEPIPEKIRKTEPVKKMRRIISAFSESEDEEIENAKEEEETEEAEEKKPLNTKSNSNVRNGSNRKQKDCNKNAENKKSSLKEEKKMKTQSRKRKASESDNEDAFPQRDISSEEECNKNLENKKKSLKVKKKKVQSKKSKGSESDNEDPLPIHHVSSEDDEDEDIIPPTPTQKVVPKGPCLQYETVKKTFQDEEGFFVTRREKCLVEVQKQEKDDEVQSFVAKTETKTATSSKPVKDTKKQKKNQSSLDFFFRKK